MPSLTPLLYTSCLFQIITISCNVNQQSIRGKSPLFTGFTEFTRASRETVTLFSCKCSIVMFNNQGGEWIHD